MKLTCFHKRLACAVLMAFGLGAAASADTVTEGFDTFKAGWGAGWTSYEVTLPEDWYYSGTAQTFETGEQGKTAKPSVGVEGTNLSTSSSRTYLITPMLQGDFDFWVRNYTKSKQAVVTAYACSYENGVLELHDQIDTKTLDKTSGSTPSWVNVTFSSPAATRVALLISQAYFDDFTYTPAVASDGPQLDITGYPNGASYDFGTVAKGTEMTFFLVNKGNEVLHIESITLTGGYTLVSGDYPADIEAGKQAEVVVATPDEDASGELTVKSNDPAETYVINLTSTYKVPKPVMAVTPREINLGKIAADASETFMIGNSGDAPLNVTLSSDNSAFDFGSATLSVDPEQEATVTVSVKFEDLHYGVNTAKITVTPTEGEGDPVVVTVTAKVADPNVWSEDFSGEGLPKGWSIEGTNNKWTIQDGVASGSYYYSSNKDYLTTPALAVESTADELTFQYRTKAAYGSVYIKIYYSKDGGEYTLYRQITESSKVVDFKDYTITGLEPGSYRFRFENEDYDLDNFEGFKLDLNAPIMSVTPLENVDFGKVTKQPEARTYTVANEGTGKLTVKIESDSDDFVVEPSTLEDIEPETPATFTLTFKFDADNLGEKSAKITVTPTYNENVAVSFTAKAIAKDPNNWDEDFEDGEMPEIWTNSGWKVEKTSSYTGNGTYMAYAGTTGNAVLVTPRLYAQKDQVLSFEVATTDSYDPLTVEYSSDKNDWTLIEGAPITTNGTVEFTAPADDFYYLRFKGKYNRIDNFKGFRLALKERDLSVASQNIPKTGYQYAEYTATITLREMMGFEETATATLMIGGEEMATATETIAPNATASITLSFTPEEGMDTAEAYIIVTYAENETLKSEKESVTIVEAPVWDEDGSADFEDETLPAVVLNYTSVDGWNSIAVPFALNDEYLEQIFGPSFSVYELNSYEDGVVKFREAIKMDNHYAAGYPYMVYKGAFTSTGATFYETEADAEDDIIILRNVRIEKTTPQSEGRGGVEFSATFSAREAGQDEKLYEIDPADQLLKEKTSVKGFRGFITLDPSITTVPRVSFFDGFGVETGVSGIEEDTILIEGIFNLNGLPAREPLAPGIYIINGKKTVVR